MQGPDKLPKSTAYHGFTPEVVGTVWGPIALYPIQICLCCHKTMDTRHSVCPVCISQSPACLGKLQEDTLTMHELALRLAPVN